MNDTATTSGVLCWPKRLLNADDLRRHLTSQRELLLLPRTIITPLAADELRAKGVRVSWQIPKKIEESAPKHGMWCCAQESGDAMISSALKALERDGITLVALETRDARRIAESIVADYRGGIVFCGDPATVCCIANKIAGLRAASVFNVAQIVRVKKTLAANLFAIETPGRTFFEVRQMLKTIVTGDTSCAADIAKVLKELDGHAHR